MPINNYNDFIHDLISAGFSTGSGSSEGIYSVIPFNWITESPDSRIRWHTGDPETDPWEWRIRVLDERDDIAYGKVFFRKSGYITREWYPYFLAARRNGIDFDEAYYRGTISYFAKRIYRVICDNGEVPFYTIKQLGGFSREDKSRFESALVELQMKLYITICGIRQKISLSGEGYGWHTTVFSTTERFWGDDLFEQADAISPYDAEEAITGRVLELNPNADMKKLRRFILG